MVIFIKVIQVIFALSLLVVVHEFGHFLFAKLFKIRVNKFYLFFNPQFSLMRLKNIGGKLKFKFFAKNVPDEEPKLYLDTLPDDDWRKYPDNTEYGIGWLPFGGYCAVAGMVDETMNTEMLKQEPQPWEFRTKKAWQRFLVMFGGVFFNIILAIVLYAAILNTWGESYLKNENAIYGIATNDLSYEMGFRDGDRILKVGNVVPDNFNMIQIELIRSQAETVTVLRGKDTIVIDIDPVYIPAMLNSPGMFSLSYPFVVSEVPEDSYNAGAGLMAGDKFVAIDSVSMILVQEIQKALAARKGQDIVATVSRDGNLTDIPLKVDTAGHIGVLLESDLTQFFTLTNKEYNFFSAIPAGAVKAYDYIKGYVKELGLIFTPKTQAYKSVGSFISIGKIFPGTWDWYRVWTITAMLSIMLAVLNIIPIPGLDGGHILFILVEIITRRKPGDKFLMVAQTVGMVLLIALMVLAMGNDIRGLFIH